jgi:hypothetical protein
MQDAFLVLLLLGGIALLVLAVTRVTARRRATEEGFVAELPLPPDLRAAMMAQKLGEQSGQRPAPTASTAGPDNAGAASGPEAGTAPAAGPALEHVPLVDALSGLELPCDLTFLGTVEAEPGVREVLAFSTSTHGAQVVGDSMATELQRLGYSLFASGERVTLATRDDLTLRVEVHSHPGSVMRKKKPAFPTAPPGAVVVEVTRS